MVTLTKTVDLNKMRQVDALTGMAFTTEQEAHRFVIDAVRGVTPEAITGSVTGRFMRPDGETVQLTPSYCAIEDGKAVVTLPGNCYLYSGYFRLVVFNVQSADPDDDNAERTVIYAAVGYIVGTQNGDLVDPENIINVDTVQEMIGDLQDAIEDAQEQATSSVQFTAQSLTDAQKAQARTNIGAGSEADVSDLKSAINNCIALVRIEITPAIVKGQRFNPGTGASGSNSNFCRTNSLIDIPSNGIRAVELADNAYTYSISYYDSTGATDGTGYINTASGLSGLTYLPQDAVKIGLTFYKGGTAMTDDDKAAIGAALKFYRQTDTTLKLNGIPADAYTVGEKLDDIGNRTEIHEIFTSWTDPADGKYASFETSSLKVTLSRTGTNRQYAVMDCKAGDTFVLHGVESNTGYMRAYIFSDDSGNVGADTTAWRANATSSGTKVYDFEVTAPVGATRIYINRTYNSEGNPDSYQALSSTEYTDKRAGNKGLKIVCLGDSIFGNFRTSFGASKGIPNMISDKIGATVYNHAFGGTHATTQSWTSPMDFQNLVAAIVEEDFTDQIAFATEKGAGYVARVNDVAATDFDDVDIVTISYGTNDWSGNATPAAYKTALEAGITALATAYPHLRFLLCTPIIRFQHVGSAPIDAETEEDEGTGEVISSDDDRMTNGGGNKLTAYVDAVEEIGRKLHIPVCENYWSLGINLLNYEVYLHGQSETDLTHPCRAGRELIAGHLVDAIKRMQV